MKLFSMRILIPTLLFLQVLFNANGQELYEIPEGIRTRWSSFENPAGKPGAGGQENFGGKGHAFDIIDPKGKKVLAEITGAGIVYRIWLTVNERFPKMLRSLRVEMYWDGAKAPAVSAPLGDFFGIGL